MAASRPRGYLTPHGIKPANATQIGLAVPDGAKMPIFAGFFGCPVDYLQLIQAS
jgi:hypothetical protein